MIRLIQCSLAISVLAGLVGAQQSLAQMYPMDSDVGVDGEELYKVCSFCHGTQSHGGPALDAPALAGMEAWYVERQLHNFRNRVRGTHYNDVPGVQMSIVSGMVRNQATIENIAATIQSMEPGAPPEVTRQGEVAGTARPFIWRSKYAALEHPDDPNIDEGKTIYAEIKLVDAQDETRGWCVDLFVHLTNAMPLGGFQGRDCFLYFGKGLQIDQGFDEELIAEGKFRLPHRDVCMTLQDPGHHSYVAAESCGNDPAQKFTMHEDGRIMPDAAPEHCLTIGSITVPGGRRTSAC